MIAELEGYEDQLLSIRQDATGLMSGLSDAQFNWQPAPNRWSMAGCFDHLNISAARIFIPSIDAAIANARSKGLTGTGPFVYSAFERWFVRINEPPPKMRFKSPARFHPATNRLIGDVRREFLTWQDEFGKRLRQADGLDLRRARHRSPLPLVSWSLGTFFSMMLTHERRHIWQARQVRGQSAFPA